MEKNLEATRWHFRQTEVEINLSRLKKNFYAIKKQAKSSKILALMKSNAYGHGLITAKYLESIPASDGLYGFAVANVEEAIELRKYKVKRPILVLSGIQSVSNDLMTCIAHYRLTPVISSLSVLADFLKNKLSSMQPYHLKINTGMNRLGINTADIAKTILLMRKNNRNFKFEGVMSHYACAEKKNSKITIDQTNKFRMAVDQYKRNGYHPKFIHIENSAGLEHNCMPESNLARVGLHLYGVGSEFVEPVMRWTAQIYDIRKIKIGEGIGYGPIFRAKKNMRIAILGVGYGDGYPRALSNKAEVLIQGKRCKVIGAVSMDMTAVDISHIENIEKKSRAILLGEDRNDCISTIELANRAGFIPWEIITGISARVPRIYKW